MVRVLRCEEGTSFEKRYPFWFHAVSFTDPERKPFQNLLPPSQKRKMFQLLKKVPCPTTRAMGYSDDQHTAKHSGDAVRNPWTLYMTCRRCAVVVHSAHS